RRPRPWVPVARPTAQPPARRLVALLAMLSLALGCILFRLVVLQVKDASAYQAMARNELLREIALPATRGTIFDRNAQPLAMSLPAKAVFADPAIVRNTASEARAVASILHLGRAEVEAKLRPGVRA